jgi:hypothetical protein
MISRVRNYLDNIPSKWCEMLWHQKVVTVVLAFVFSFVCSISNINF